MQQKSEAKGIEKGRKKGRAEGRTGGFLESIKKMVENFNVSASKAMDVLEIPENKRSFYIEKLKEMK